MRHAPAPTISQTGRRSENEDAVWLRSTTDSSGKSISVLAVADGMGGHTHGAKASEIAIRGVQDAVEDWMDSSDSLDEDQLRIKCRQLFGRIDQAIEIYTDEHPDAEGMGTTLVLVVVIGDQAYVAHIGDSRAYWVSSDKTADQLTLDHSAAAEAVREGRMTEEEVAGSAFQHALTRSLDGSGDSDPDFGVHPIDEPGFLVLCSDGLSGAVEDSRLAEELLRSAPLAETTEALVDAAFEQGSEDNISLVVLECGTVERKESAAATAPPPSEPSSAGQPPPDQPSSSEPASETRSSEPPVRDTSPGRSTSTRSGTPQWATMLLGVLVVALLGLGGWAEYRYDVLGLFPPKTDSTPPPIADAESPTPKPSRSNAEGDDNASESGSNSEPDGGQQDNDQAKGSESENNQSIPDRNESSSPEQGEGSDSQAEAGPPADIAGRDDETSDEPSKNEGDASASESSQTAGEGSSDQAAPGGSDGAGSEGPTSLGTERVRKVVEGKSREQIIPHEEFDSEAFLIKTVNGTDRVGSEMKLESGALLIVGPEGHLTYAPNGAFETLDQGEATEDQFTYTAVSDSGDNKLRGTVVIPISGKNTPPRLEGTKELTLRAGEVSPITPRALRATDPDDEPEEIQFTGAAGPSHGQIRVGDDSDLASADSSFTQRDVEEGRVFYAADTTGQAVRDTITFVVKDDNGARLEGQTFRVSIDKVARADPTESATTNSESTEAAPSTDGDCRIQFAAKSEGELTSEDSTVLADEPLVDTLQSKGVPVEVKYAENNQRSMYGLFSRHSGTREEMERRKQKLLDEGIAGSDEGIVNDPFVHCF